MCGIAGYWNLNNGRAQKEILESMIDRMAYRGPDDRGVWAQGPVGLGHCRLSIIDLSNHGHQPFVTQDGKGVLAYNGEVYNFKELRQELEKEGVRFHSQSDTEVVLYALHQWGPARAVPRFNGMFGLAYYDLRRKELVLARDRMGIKPLYYTHAEDMIAFASEVKALLVHPRVKAEPDVQVLSAFLMHQRIEGDWTPFRNIQQLTAGSFLTVGSNFIRKTLFFDPVENLDPKRIIENSKRDRASLVHEFETLFRNSVQHHLISDAPLAAMVSGGLDSSLIAAQAKIFKDDLVGYVADVKGAIASEGDKAEVVGGHLGIPIRRIQVDRTDLLALWPEAVWHGDFPNCHANDMPYILVTRACREDGIKVMLTGEGSDELFGGYPWHAQTYKTWRMRRFHHAIFRNNALTKALRKMHPFAAALPWNALQKDPFMRREQIDYIQDALRAGIATDGGRRQTRYNRIFGRLGSIDPIEDRAYLARVIEDCYANLQAVLHRNDRISMAASIESRPPFLENALIDFALHLPRNMKWHQAQSKWIVKEAAKSKLPRSIVFARKLQFPVDMQGFRLAGALLKNGTVAELFKMGNDEVREMVGRASSYPTVIHNLIGVEIWARLFLRGEPREQISEALSSACHSEGAARGIYNSEILRHKTPQDDKPEGALLPLSGEVAP